MIEKTELTDNAMNQIVEVVKPILEEKDKEIARLTAESTKWESKFYDEAKKVDKAIEYMERYMFIQKENYDYIHLLDILKRS